MASVVGAILGSIEAAEAARTGTAVPPLESVPPEPVAPEPESEAVASSEADEAGAAVEEDETESAGEEGPAGDTER